MEQPYLKIKKVREGAVLPTKRVEDACYDLYGVFDKDVVFLYPGDIQLTPLGISSEFPINWVFYIVERSSAGSKGISTRCGVIDSGYRGEIFTPINNTTNRLIIITNKTEEEVKSNYQNEMKGFEENFKIYPQTKAIAQGMLLYCPHVDVEEVEELNNNSERGTGTLGSTNK